jgi:hypothetical protein
VLIVSPNTYKKSNETSIDKNGPRTLFFTKSYATASNKLAFLIFRNDSVSTTTSFE